MTIEREREKLERSFFSCCCRLRFSLWRKINYLDAILSFAFSLVTLSPVIDEKRKKRSRRMRRSGYVCILNIELFDDLDRRIRRSNCRVVFSIFIFSSFSTWLRCRQAKIRISSRVMMNRVDLFFPFFSFSSLSLSFHIKVFNQ